jgi:hypothetical protein
VVVLAVDVVGYRSAHGNPLGTRKHRNKPAARCHQVEHLCQSDACLAAKESLGFVKGDEASAAGDVDQSAAVIETAVTVTAAAGEGQDALGDAS